jgi:hypothetical protein
MSLSSSASTVDRFISFEAEGPVSAEVGSVPRPIRCLRFFPAPLGALFVGQIGLAADGGAIDPGVALIVAETITELAQCHHRGHSQNRHVRPLGGRWIPCRHDGPAAPAVVTPVITPDDRADGPVPV